MSLTAPGRVGNLPLELTSFVGRRREVAEAKRVLSASRLVTLTGVGGVGKSRLALRVATQVQRAFDDGEWLVELGELQDPELVAHTVADTLGLREQSTMGPGEQLELSPVARLTEYLAARQVLLVLDNCGHVVDAVAKLVDALLRSCPGLRVLATSRERLGVGGEITLPVPPLSVPDPRQPHSLPGLSRFEAVTLFMERAVAVVPGFCLTADNDVAVAEICRRLDGLPLAIELAAARLPVLSPGEILRRLSDRFQLLETRLRGTQARHRTLRACIEWSYELCTRAEQRLWARLTVFVGSFEPVAAESICAGDGLASEDVFELMTSLVDKSILVCEDDGTVVRYRLLDTIREYGQDKLRESDQNTEPRRRHRDWYAELVARADAEWISPRQVDWFARLEREYPNIRAALESCLTEPGQAGVGLRMATSLYLYWFGRGLLSEGRHWLDRALAQQPRPCVDRGRALYVDSMLAGHQGDVAATSTLVAEGQQVAEQLGDASMRALFTLASGYLAIYRGDLRHAVALLDAALDTYRAEGDIPRLLETLLALALASEGLGDPARALACHEEALAITEPRGEVWYRSISLWVLGLALWQQGDLRRATGLVRESLRLKLPLNDLLGFAWCLEALAWIAAGEPDRRRAATLLGAVQECWQAIGASPAKSPHLLGYHDECEQRTRHALGEQAFQAAFQRGVDLGLTDAIGYALDEKPQPARSPAGTTTTLTQREQQVADLVAEGLTNKGIAARLVISQRTAESHVKNIMTKLGFTKRTQLATWVTEQRES
ncbi:LuxR family transcriptional regulator [Saccharothrix sp. ALI-22-I]|uniref:ATP-binding protein n=1 Tax=Saccharothrix sp. ALI-22-I TaxID=1933778 RepID=UPI00097C66D3|nr:LuxR C-terminal-related transcriptional regulator [Saccharothrix sp. ALI-22-I]ONI92041.1 LuxR family transcriptional regulator [Saccharothrix sp. ALI-22-I]